MGLAIDTVLYEVATPDTTFTPADTSNSGDPSVIRNFPNSSRARIVEIVRSASTSGAVRLLSPLLHDDVTGITFYTDGNPSLFTLPTNLGQPVQPGDTITVQATGDSTNDVVVGLIIHYDDLTGAAANLYQWGDIAGSIKALKPMTVAVEASGTVGAWSDTVLTTTENQLHATSYYAVLGYVTDTPLALVGVRGQMTSNLRVCGPGTDIADDSSNYFVDKSRDWGIPYIPVFNGQDRGAVYVSVADSAASTGANITLVLAELSGSFSRV